MGISVALRAFVFALFNSEVSRRIEKALDGPFDDFHSVEDASLSTVSETSKIARLSLGPSVKREGGSRSEALELLAALQRDARFIDFIKEDVSCCDDVSLAAAARTTHDRCAETLERFFQIRPLSGVPEGEITRIDPTAQTPVRFRVSGTAAHTLGTDVACRVAHAGWIAEKCEPPRWSGREEDALVLAPAELEVVRP